MINSPTIGTVTLLIQAAVQPAFEGLIISPFESTSLWVDDCITIIALGSY